MQAAASCRAGGQSSVRANTFLRQDFELLDNFWEL
jgi:hypothetical protein